MFGQEGIYGKYIIGVDSKNRIFLPPKTKREEGDGLAIIDAGDYLVICPIENILKKVRSLENRCSVIIDSEKKDMLRKELWEIYNSILNVTTVDKQGRIHFNSFIKFLDNEVVCVGANDKLLISKDQVEINLKEQPKKVK